MAIYELLGYDSAYAYLKTEINNAKIKESLFNLWDDVTFWNRDDLSVDEYNELIYLLEKRAAELSIH